MKKELDQQSWQTKRKTRIDHFGNPQPTHIAKDIIIKRVSNRKSHSGEKAEGATVHRANISGKSKAQGIQSHERLFEKIKCVAYRSPRSNQRASRKCGEISLQPSQ